MLCPNCGAENLNSAKFCKNCGGEIKQVQNRVDINRPDRVSLALKLLWAGIAIGVVNSIYTTSNLPSAIQIFVAIELLFSFALTGFFIYMIGNGRNWARITLLVFFVVGAPFSIPIILSSLPLNPIPGILGLGLDVLQVIALVFLFQKPSSDWFKSIKIK